VRRRDYLIVINVDESRCGNQSELAPRLNFCVSNGHLKSVFNRGSAYIGGRYQGTAMGKVVEKL
jgi:hypothetical protein